jgi:hypothetical protein
MMVSVYLALSSRARLCFSRCSSAVCSNVAYDCELRFKRTIFLCSSLLQRGRVDNLLSFKRMVLNGSKVKGLIEIYRLIWAVLEAAEKVDLFEQFVIMLEVDVFEQFVIMIESDIMGLRSHDYACLVVQSGRRKCSVVTVKDTP